MAPTAAWERVSPLAAAAAAVAAAAAAAAAVARAALAVTQLQSMLRTLASGRRFSRRRSSGRPSLGGASRRPSAGGVPPVLHAAESASGEVQSIARDFFRGQVTRDTSLMDMGLDSLGMMEFQGRLADRIDDGGSGLPSTLIFDHPTLRQLEGFFDSRSAVAAAAAASAPTSASVAGGARGGGRHIPPECAESARGPPTLRLTAAPSAAIVPGNAGALASIGSAAPPRGAMLCGMSARLPAGTHADEAATAWLRAGASLVQDVVCARGWSQSDVAAAAGRAQFAGVVHAADEFDPAFFDISRSETRAMDPQQRLLLEHGYQALASTGRGKA